MEGGLRARRGGWIVRQRRSGRWGKRRGVGDEHRGARSGAFRRGGERESGREVGGGGEEAEGGLRHGVDTRPGNNMAPTCHDQVVARRPLQGEASAGEGVIGVTWKDGGPAVATEGGGRAPSLHMSVSPDHKGAILFNSCYLVLMYACPMQTLDCTNCCIESSSSASSSCRSV
jgi:hypothetical protein